MATATHRIAAAIASQNARSIYCHSQSFQNLFLRLALANLRVNHSSFGKQDLFSDNIFQFFLFLAFHFLDFFFIHTLDHTGKQHGSYYKRDHFQRKVVSEYQRCHKRINALMIIPASIYFSFSRQRCIIGSVPPLHPHQSPCGSGNQTKSSYVSHRAARVS